MGMNHIIDCVGAAASAAVADARFILAGIEIWMMALCTSPASSARFKTINASFFEDHPRKPCSDVKSLPICRK